MQEITDAILIQAKQGNRQAFRAIYDACSGFVYSVAMRVLRHPETAEEVTQDVFMKVYDHLKHFQSRSSLKTWIYRITVNTAFNAAKKRKSEDRAVALDEIKWVSPGDGDEGKRQEAKEKVHQLLGRLAPEQRMLIVLREIEGLSYEEMAAAFNLNLNTLRTRLRRAREAFVNFARKEVMCHEM